jgi:hypothetical protein
MCVRASQYAGLFEALVASQGMAVAFGDGNDAARSLQMVRTTPDALAVSDPSSQRCCPRGRLRGYSR